MQPIHAEIKNLRALVQYVLVKRRDYAGEKGKIKNRNICVQLQENIITCLVFF